jgi:hypothetical protein
MDAEGHAKSNEMTYQFTVRISESIVIGETRFPCSYFFMLDKPSELNVRLLFFHDV